MGQATKAREFDDRLRVHGIREKFRATAPAEGSTGNIPEQISRLSELHGAGILTDDEFAAKKAELLARM